MRFYRSLLFIIAGLLTLTHLSGQAVEVRTYHDSITSLTDTVRLLQPNPSATVLTLEIRFTMPGKITPGAERCRCYGMWQTQSIIQL